MTPTRICALVIAALLLYPAQGVSHHAFSPVYDGSKVVSIDGVVTEFRFINPHALMSLDVRDAAGNVVKWTVEFGGNLQLIEAGWSADSVKVGERLRVSGNPTHTGSPRIAFTRLTKADGTELLPLSEKMTNAIEEERRRRALAREKK
jgi:hypothetical protein